MYLLFIVILYMSFSYPQSDSIDCSVLHSYFSRYCIIVEKRTEIIGGIESLYENLIYPSEAIENKIEGKVYLIVIIDTTGNPQCPKVIKSLGYGCDEEAIRLIMNTKFIPYLSGGKPVTAPLPIPISFKLPD